MQCEHSHCNNYYDCVEWAAPTIANFFVFNSVWTNFMTSNVLLCVCVSMRIFGIYETCYDAHHRVMIYVS